MNPDEALSADGDVVLHREGNNVLSVEMRRGAGFKQMLLDAGINDFSEEKIQLDNIKDLGIIPKINS